MNDHSWSPERLDDRFNAVQRELDILAREVQSFSGTPVELSRLAEAVEGVKERMDALREEVRAMAAAIAKRDEVMIQERMANRRALWALVAALIVALIGAFATVMAAGVL